MDHITTHAVLAPSHDAQQIYASHYTTTHRHTHTDTKIYKTKTERHLQTVRQLQTHTHTHTHTHRCRHKRTHAYHHYRHHQDNAIRADVASGFGEDGRTCTRLPSGARCRIYCLPLPMMPKYCEQATATLLSSNGLNSTCGRRGEVAPRKRYTDVWRDSSSSQVG